jgi:hypothetical protein
MRVRNDGGSLIVRVPGPSEDRPSWRRVGIIATIGFVVGIAWPRLAGVRLGPSLPEAASASASAIAPTTSVPPPVLSRSAAPSTAAVASTSILAVASTHSPPALPAPVAPSPTPTPAGSTLRGNPRSSPSGVSASVRSVADEGSAQVVWEVALVRDVPKGKIVARLPRGTQVRLGAAKDGWYPVKYGDNFSGDGWVFRGAIGR